MADVNKNAGWIGLDDKGAPCFGNVFDFAGKTEYCPIYKSKAEAVDRYRRVAKITFTVEEVRVLRGGRIEG